MRFYTRSLSILLTLICLFWAGQQSYAASIMAIAAQNCPEFISAAKATWRVLTGNRAASDQEWRLRAKTTREFPPLEEIKDADTASLSYAKFTVLKVYKGLHGGRRYLVRKNEISLDGRQDVKGEDGADRIPNVNLPPYLLSGDVAYLAGFQIIDERHFIMPDDEELRGFTEFFNKELSPEDPRYILISTLPDEGVAEGQKFNHEFRVSQRVPVAKKGRQRFHDILTHGLQGFFNNNKAVKRLVYYLAIGEDVILDMKTGWHAEDYESLRDLEGVFSDMIDGLSQPMFTMTPVNVRAFLKKDIKAEIARVKRDYNIKMYWEEKSEDYGFVGAAGIFTNDVFDETGLIRYQPSVFWVHATEPSPLSRTSIIVRQKAEALARSGAYGNLPPLPATYTEDLDKLRGMRFRNLSPEEWEAALDANASFSVVTQRLHYARELAAKFFAPTP